jgi:hypothetical protein
MKINWNEAPSATHYDKRKGCLPAFMRKSTRGNEWEFLKTNGEWMTYGVLTDEEAAKLKRRPASKAPWTGEGLPPVGTVCEYNVGGGGWFECEIRYVTTPYHDCPVEVVMFPPHLGGEQTGVVGNGPGEVSFRPIRTPEQIAAEEREKDVIAVLEVMKFAHWNIKNTEISPLGKCRIYAEAMVDAGYRKQVAQ